MRLDARVGYGLRVPGRDGLLTPFMETTRAAADTHRLGLNWHSKLNRDSRLDLSLTGERDDGGDAVVLKGTVHLGR